MKHKINSFLLSIVFLLIPLNLSYAQNDDTIERDLKIMKTILAELFQIESSSDVRFQLNSRLITEKDISATYQPGYGIIFSIPDIKSNRFMIVRSDDEKKAKLFFKYDSSLDDSREVNDQTIETRMRDFFKNYTSPITYLPDDERLLLLFGKSLFKTGGAGSISFRGDATLIGTNKSPEITLSARIRDIKEFQQKRIDEQEFNRRITRENIFESDKNRTDLAILSTILTSAFDESDSHLLKITRKPALIYLPGFGVMYRVDLRQSGNFFARFNIDGIPEIRTQIDSLQTNTDRFRFDMDSLRLHLDSIRIDYDDIRIMADSLRKQIGLNQSHDSAYSRQIENALREAHKQYRDAEWQIRSMYSENSFPGGFTFIMADTDTIQYEKELDKSLDVIKEVMLTYGGTLSSIKPDETLMVSINISVRSENVPDVVHLKIRKTDIDRYKKGELTRDQALAKISQRYE